jgi:hypothetical protein
MAQLALLLVIILTLGGFGLIYYLLRYELPRSAEPPPKVLVIDRKVPASPSLPTPPHGVVIVRRVVVVRPTRPSS